MSDRNAWFNARLVMKTTGTLTTKQLRELETALDAAYHVEGKTVTLTEEEYLFFLSIGLLDDENDLDAES